MNTAAHNEAFDDADESVDAQLSELVAYLDGELDDQTNDQVERKLVADPGFRRYAESLDRTWQLLDSLGDAPASGAFTQKTLASIASLAPEPDATNPRSVVTRLRSLPLVRIAMWFSAAFVGTSAGLLLARVEGPAKSSSQDVQLLQHLDLLEHYEKYYPVPNADFLNDIAAKKKPLNGGDAKGNDQGTNP